MRVIAGEAKGRKLRSVQSSEVRPSGDRVKEAMFSTIGPRVVGALVLDLFAGSGALGIEAISRGARSAVFVEHDYAAATMIEQNLESVGFTNRAVIFKGTVEQYLSHAATDAFDLVLIDPPYDLGLPSDVLASLRDGGYLADGALVVLEASSRKLPFEPVEGFRVTGERKYGDSAVVYMQRAHDEEGD